MGADSLNASWPIHCAERTKRRHHARGTSMKYRINIDEGVVAPPRIVRLLVLIFCPWLALWVARKQLWLACLVIRNAGMARYPEDENMIRWADELHRDGNMIPEPNDQAHQPRGESAAPQTH